MSLYKKDKGVGMLNGNKWVFFDLTEDELIEKLISNVSNEDGSITETLKHRVRGRQLWTVQQTVKADGTKERELVLFYLKKMGSQWGYQKFTEADEPPYYACAFSFLRLVPEKSNKWRNELIEHIGKEENLKKQNNIITVA